MFNTSRAVIVSFLVGLCLISCTKKDNNRIDYQSALKFTYDESLVGTDTAAKSGDDVITVSQLFSPSPALQELEERINKEVMRTTYEKALAMKKDGKEVAVSFGFAEPKETLKVLFKTKFDKNIAVTFDPTLKHQAAQINSDVLTRDKLAGENLLLGKLAAESFRQKVQSLEGILSRRRILQESKTANMPMEEYIKQNVLKDSPAITDEDVLQYALQNNMTEKDLDEETKIKLKDIILGRRREQLIIAYVAKKFLKEPIHVAFPTTHVRMEVPPMEKVATVKGHGPIQITLLSQFECKECRDVEQSLVELANDQPKYYQLNYLFNFSDSHPEERMIAEASLCLQKQKDDYFWQFPLALSKSKGGAIEEDINNTAKGLGANFETFRSCFLAREFKDTIDSQMKVAKQMGFYTSPVVILDGRVYEAPLNTHEILEQAREIRADKGLGFNFFYNLKKSLFGT